MEPDRAATLRRRVEVPASWEGERLDHFLAQFLELGNRSRLRSRGVRATINGSAARLSRKVRAGDVVEAELPPLQPSPLEPEKIELSILFENRDLLVIDKPQGMVVHPGAGNPRGTLVNALIYHSEELREAFPHGPQERPGVVHRLDKETSGVIIAAKHPDALERLASQFKRRTTEKVYIAILRGHLPRGEGELSGYIRRDPRNRKRFVYSAVEGKAARTKYKVLRRFASGYTLVRFEPTSGRTHQLRVHAAHLQAPILGDPVYSRRDNRFPEATMMLHAFSLKITVPGETEPRRFRAPLPKRFRYVVDALHS